MDPYFDVAAAELRGFDLGDDAELSAALQEKRENGHGVLTAEDWMLLAILRFREGDTEDAIGCLERAARLGHVVSLARYLQGQVLLATGDIDDAAASFDQAAAARLHDAHLPEPEVIHAQGSIARARQEPEEALVLYRRALQLDSRSSGRWRATAELLLELDRPHEAHEALLRALEEDPEENDPLYFLAVTSAALGEFEATAHWLRTLLQRDPNARSRALQDERLTAIDDPRVTGVLHLASATDLEWLEQFPSWLAALRDGIGIERFGLRWVCEAESREFGQRMRETYEQGPIGTMHTPATLALARELLDRSRLVAFGPSSTTRDRIREPTLLFIDETNPDGLRLALSESYPPFLWLDAGTTTATLLESLATVFPRPRLRRLEMTRTARGFMGYRLRFGVPSPYSGEIEPANAAELDRHFAVNPFVESASWGSAFADDPWPDEIPRQPGYVSKIAIRQREVNQQAEGAVWSVSRRTRHSRSYLSIELHHRDIFVIEVRYRPAEHYEVIDDLNGHFGCDYPTDMPLDAVAALLGFQFDSIEDLTARLDTTADPEQLAGLLTVLSALRHSDLGVVRYYRRYMDHPEPVVRATLCNIFAAYNYESMLEEMSVVEPDEEIRAQIEALLDRGIPAPQHDPYSDYDTDDDNLDDDEVGPNGACA